MTTIAFRDGTLASDSLMTFEGAGGTTKYHAPKIYREAVSMPCLFGGIEMVLFGVAGTTEAEANFLEFVRQGSPPGTTYHEAVLRTRNDLDVICVWSGGAVMLDGAGAIVLRDAPYYAIGSGRNPALAAMKLNATAEQAVGVACEIDLHSGGPVVAQTL